MYMYMYIACTVLYMYMYTKFYYTLTCTCTLYCTCVYLHQAPLVCRALPFYFRVTKVTFPADWIIENSFAHIYVL